MTVETAGVPVQTGESAPAAPTGSEGFTLRIIVEASTGPRDDAPYRFRCESDDGSALHLALTVEMPAPAAALQRVAKLRCACGGTLALVSGSRPRT